MLSDRLRVAQRIASELFYHSYCVKSYLERIGPGGSNEHQRLIDILLRVLEHFELPAINGFAAFQAVPDTQELQQQAIEYLQMALRNIG